MIDRGGHRLAAAFKELDPASIVDPEGEGAEALERAEACFHAQRSDLSHFRAALVDAGAPPDRGVFEALDRLDGLYARIVATMQEVLRWSVLIADGRRAPASERRFTSGASLVAAVDE